MAALAQAPLRVLLCELMRPRSHNPTRSSAGHGRGVRHDRVRRASCGDVRARPGIHGRRKRRTFAPKAKHVIFVFLTGGLSAIDSFDRKPLLDKYDGKPLPYPTPRTEFATGNLMRSPFKFTKYGQNGHEVSEIFPNIGRIIDDFCQVRSMVTDIPNHGPSVLMMNTGNSRFGTAVDGLVDHVWARHGESESAGIHRAGAECGRRWRRQPVGLGVPARGLSGHARSDRRDRSAEADPHSDQSEAQPGESSGASSICCAGSTRCNRKSWEGSRARSHHPIDGSRVPHANRGARRFRYPQRERRHHRGVRRRANSAAAA